MNKRFFYFGVGILLLWEGIFFVLMKTVTEFDKVISSQKELFEIFGLIVVLLSGKLILDGISYVKELNIKNLKETIGLMSDYDDKMDQILDRLVKFDGKKSEETYLLSIAISKVIVLLRALEDIIDNSLNPDHRALFLDYISHLYFKTYLMLLNKGYLIPDGQGGFRLVGSVESQMRHQISSATLTGFLITVNKFKKRATTE